MMKAKVLFMITRGSTIQDDEIEFVTNDQKKINMTKVKVSARFTFRCGVLLRRDDDCRPADDLVCLHLFHNGDDVDDNHCHDV